MIKTRNMLVIALTVRVSETIDIINYVNVYVVYNIYGATPCPQGPAAGNSKAVIISEAVLKAI